jgi:hypothetical protein
MADFSFKVVVDVADVVIMAVRLLVRPRPMKKGNQ